MAHQVALDLSQHAWEQMRPVFHRAIALAEDGSEKTQVAIAIAASVIGAAAGVFGAAHELSPSNVDEAGVAILDILREMLPRNAQGGENVG